MKSEPSGLSDWTAEEIAQGKQWVEAWKRAGPELEKIRREELRRVDSCRAIALLCGPADYRVPPRAPKPTSGLVEQQRWFKKAAVRQTGKLHWGEVWSELKPLAELKGAPEILVELEKRRIEFEQ